MTKSSSDRGFCLFMVFASLMTARVHGFSVESNKRVFVSTPASKFPKKLVSDYMATQPILLKPDTSVDDAMELFLRHGIAGAAVVDDTQNLVGLLSSYDFLDKEAFEGALLPIEGTIERVEQYVHVAQRICGQNVADIMTTLENLETVTPETPMRQAAAIMSRNKFHRLPVVTAGGTFMGILSAEHVMQDMHQIVRNLPPAKDNGNVSP